MIVELVMMALVMVKEFETSDLKMYTMSNLQAQYLDSPVVLLLLVFSFFLLPPCLTARIRFKCFSASLCNTSLSFHNNQTRLTSFLLISVLLKNSVAFRLAYLHFCLLVSIHLLLYFYFLLHFYSLFLVGLFLRANNLNNIFIWQRIIQCLFVSFLRLLMMNSSLVDCRFTLFAI